MKPTRRRSLSLATQQKSFLCISDLRAPDFFFSKEKKTFLLGSALNEQGGGTGLFLISLGRRAPKKRFLFFEDP